MLSKDKYTMPNPIFFGYVLDYIKQGKCVKIPVKGKSMQPFLREGDTVLLRPFEKSEVRKGLIVLAKMKDRVVLHRVVKYDDVKIWLAGDGNLVEHDLIKYADVIASVVSLSRGHMTIQLNQRWRCYIGQMWYWTRPIRRIINKIF